ncbi:MAG: DUF2917 domain-containing protein [Usitatibacter sp.]
MNLTIDRPTLALEEGQVVSLDDIAGTRISARAGTLWITCEDSRRDVILHAGESVVVTRGGRTVLQALQPAYVSLQ